MPLAEMVCSKCGATFEHTELLRLGVVGVPPRHVCPYCKECGVKFNIPDKSKVTFTITAEDLFGNKHKSDDK